MTSSTATSSIFSGPCSIKETELCGRGVFADEPITRGTLLLRTAPPCISVIHRPYRKEVCAHCFNYDRGKVWSLKDKSVGFSFCSTNCQELWRSSLDEVAYSSYQAVEALVKRKQKKSNIDDYDDPMIDVGLFPPSAKEIKRAWIEAEAVGQRLRDSRLAAVQSPKAERRALRQTEALPLEPSSMAYLHAGLVASINTPQKWLDVLKLHTASSPYPATAILSQNVHAYLHLLAVMPPDFLHNLSPELCLAVASRDAFNAFGIRSLDDGGEEHFGHGIWQEASYFNHSCDPNVQKVRNGASWEFRTARDVEASEELCITYLGGEEWHLSLNQRRDKLFREWGFWCKCSRCDE